MTVWIPDAPPTLGGFLTPAPLPAPLLPLVGPRLTGAGLLVGASFPDLAFSEKIAVVQALPEPQAATVLSAIGAAYAKDVTSFDHVADLARVFAVDLRDDWQTALTDAGFDPTRPSAWIAEGLLIYLPATAQEQLFAGIDALAAPGSWVAIEEGKPMPADVFAAKRAASDEMADGFFKLIYNEQIAPAEDWFGARGWRGATTPLADYLRQVGRPVPTNPEAATMIASNSLVTAVKE